MAARRAAARPAMAGHAVGADVRAHPDPAARGRTRLPARRTRASSGARCCCASSTPTPASAGTLFAGLGDAGRRRRPRRGQLRRAVHPHHPRHRHLHRPALVAASIASSKGSRNSGARLPRRTPRAVPWRRGLHRRRTSGARRGRRAHGARGRHRATSNLDGYSVQEAADGAERSRPGSRPPARAGRARRDAAGRRRAGGPAPPSRPRATSP